MACLYRLANYPHICGPFALRNDLDLTWPTYGRSTSRRHRALTRAMATQSGHMTAPLIRSRSATMSSWLISCHPGARWRMHKGDTGVRGSVSKNPPEIGAGKRCVPMELPLIMVGQREFGEDG